MLAVVVPGGAAVESAVVGGDDVSRSMTAGAFILQGTHPVCTVVEPAVEFHCMLDRAPFHEVDDFTGTVHQTVDATST